MYHQVETPNEQFLELGAGFDMLLGELRPSAFAPASIPALEFEDLGGERGFVDTLIASNMERAYDLFKLHAAANAGFLGWRVKSKLEVLREVRTHALSRSYLLRAECAVKQKVLRHADTTRLQLSDEAHELLDQHGYDAFRQKYGDGFVRVTVHGAEIVGTYSLESLEAKKLSELTSSTEAKALMANGQLDFSKLSVEKNESVTAKFMARHRGLHLDRLPGTAAELKEIAETLPKLARAYPESAEILRFEVADYASLPGFLTGGDLAEAREALDRLAERRLALLDSREAWDFARDHAEALQLAPEDCERALRASGESIQAVEESMRQLSRNPRDDAAVTAASALLAQLGDPMRPAMADVIRGPLEPRIEMHDWKRVSGGDDDIHSGDGRKTSCKVRFELTEVTPKQLAGKVHFEVREHGGNKTVLGGAKPWKLEPEPGYSFVPLDKDEIGRSGSVQADIQSERHDHRPIGKERLADSAFSKLKVRFDSKHGDDRPYVGIVGHVRLNVTQVRLP